MHYFVLVLITFTLIIIRLFQLLTNTYGTKKIKQKKLIKFLGVSIISTLMLVGLFKILEQSTYTYNRFVYDYTVNPKSMKYYRHNEEIYLNITDSEGNILSYKNGYVDNLESKEVFIGDEVYRSTVFGDILYLEKYAPGVTEDYTVKYQKMTFFDRFAEQAWPADFKMSVEKKQEESNK